MNITTPSSSATPTSSTPAPWWGSISLLWLMLTPLIVVIYTLLIPIAPNDFWYNARAGAHIAATGSIPTTAMFTTSVAPGTPYFNQAWLSQLLIFKTLESTGLSGIVLLRAFCLTATFLLVLLTAWRRISRLNRDGNVPIQSITQARIVAGSTLLAFALSASNMDIRPQTFSVPLFALFLFCIFEWQFLKAAHRVGAIIFLALLMTLWANLHGAFFTGLILLGALLTGEATLFWAAPRNAAITRIFGNSSRKMLFQTALLFAAACGAALINPRGAELYAYVFKLAALQAGQKYIQEWQAPNFSQWYGALFFVSLALIIVVTGVLLRAPQSSSGVVEGKTLPKLGLSLGEVFIFAAVTLMALRDIRSIIWFALVLAPVSAALAMRVLQHRTTNSTTLPAAPVPRTAQAVNAIIAVMLLLSIVPFLPQLRAALPLPQEYSENFAPTPRDVFPYGFKNDPPFLLERNTPVEAAAYLRANPPDGKVWNDMVFGSYLTWAGFPDVLPHADPRVELYPLEFWEEYARLLSGPADAAKTLHAGGFSAALVHRKDGKQLIHRLQNAGWRIASRHRDALLLLAPRDATQ